MLPALAKHWQRIHFGNVSSTPAEGGYHFDVQVYLDELSSEAIRVELYAGPIEGDEPFSQSLERGELLAGTVNAYVYQGTIPSDRPASDYTPRIVPVHGEASVPLESGFILWYR